MHILSITAIFCVNIYTLSAKEVGKTSATLSQTEIKTKIPVVATLNKDSNFNLSELEAARVKECKCKNGKCVRACDLVKTIPCADEVCVCNPEFARKEEGVCEYCDCGEGFNCTFSNNIYGFKSVDCICPTGFYEEGSPFNSKCKAECSDEKPCQNGGTCSNKRCKCPIGTRGALCEEITACSYMCQNRLEVDCRYNQHYQMPYCSCKNSSLFYDEKADICKTCPCENGYCEYTYGLRARLSCSCRFGYKVFNGYCKKCECDSMGYGKCEFDSKGNKICKCADGFYKKDGRCHACSCNYISDTHIKCEVTGDVKRCFCSEGYKNVDGHCEEIEACEDSNPCHPSAECWNIFGKAQCHCPGGYRGTNSDGEKVAPGEECVDIDECNENPLACWHWDSQCVNLPGTYKCECLKGYEPISKLEEPQKTSCVGTTKNWGPALIVIFTTLIIMTVSGMMHSRVKNRAYLSN